MPDRRKFISQLGLGLAAIPFLSLLYGVTIGKYNYKVIKQRIFFPDLPDAKSKIFLMKLHAKIRAFSAKSEKFPATVKFQAFS